MEREASRCAVRRSAVVQAIGTAETALLVNGKTVVVPGAKVDPGASVGDEVSWDGRRWTPLPEQP